MRFFLDTANLEELKTAAKWGIVDGVTTNPSLIAKEGITMQEQVRRICEIIDGDISAEVIATDSDNMLVEGRELAKIHKNIVVKLPTMAEGLTATHALAKDGIRVNMTLCFTANQALLAAAAGAVPAASSATYRPCQWRRLEASCTMRGAVAGNTRASWWVGGVVAGFKARED